MSIFDTLVNCRLTPEECTLLAETGFVLVGDLLQRMQYKDKFIFNLNLSEIALDPELRLTKFLIQKLNWLVGNVKKYIPSIKKSCLDYASDDKWIGWNRVVFYA